MADFDHYGAEPVFRRGGYSSNPSNYAYGATAQRAYGQADPVAPQAPSASAGGALGRVISGIGALVSIALVVGMGLWAWQLTVRDVSGVPVIRAIEGPMRSLPDNPGGSQAPHQGLAVNRIAEGSEATPVPDRIVLAPPPVDLDELDVAIVTPEPRPDDTQALIDRVLQAGVAPLQPVAEGDAAASDPALETGADVTDAGTRPEVDPDTQVTAAIIPASVPGVSRSLRPLTRPAGLDTERSSVLTSSSQPQGSAATGPTEAADGVAELSIDTLPAGTRLVQLGAFDSPEIARAEWVRLAGQYPDYFSGRDRIVQQASSGGQAFYRLRANGFADLEASRRFCAAMVQRGAACIPVTVR